MSAILHAAHVAELGERVIIAVTRRAEIPRITRQIVEASHPERAIRGHGLERIKYASGGVIVFVTASSPAGMRGMWADLVVTPAYTVDARMAVCTRPHGRVVVSDEV